MTMEFEVLAAYLAQKSAIKGKKAFQKLVYLAKSLGYPIHAEYRMYLYGPFSQEVASELDEMVSCGLLNVLTDQTSIGGTTRSNEVLLKNKEFLSHNEGVLKKLWELFGDRTPKELELIATAHFIAQTLKEHYGITDRAKVLEHIAMAKYPKFTYEEIEKTYDAVCAIKELQ